VLDTLGAAYAEAGEFPRALQTAQHALEVATSQGNGQLEQMIEARIRLYRENKPYRN